MRGLVLVLFFAGLLGCTHHAYYYPANQRAYQPLVGSKGVVLAKESDLPQLARVGGKVIGEAESRSDDARGGAGLVPVRLSNTAFQEGGTHAVLKVSKDGSGYSTWSQGQRRNPGLDTYMIVRVPPECFGELPENLRPPEEHIAVVVPNGLECRH